MIAFVIIAVIVAIAIILVTWLWPDDLPLECPTCGTTQLRQYGMGSFQRSFQCQNGHGFSVPTEGP